MRGVWILIICGLIVGAFAIQRTVVAKEGQHNMFGLSGLQVIACLGAPATKSVVGISEIWSFAPGNKNKRTAESTLGNVGPGYKFSAANALEKSFCTFEVTMVGGNVTQANYVGSTGDLLTQNEQCTFTIQNCFH